jgi:hypothetical protein
MKKCFLLKVGNVCCVKRFTTGTRNYLKDVRKSDDAWPGSPLEIATEATVQQVEQLIKADRRITIDSVTTALGCSSGLAYSIMHGHLKFRKVCAWWVSRKLRVREKMNRSGLSLQHLLQYADEGEDTSILNRTVNSDKSCVQHYQHESKRASMQRKQPSSPSTKKFKVTPLAGKVAFTVFWDSFGVLLAHFQKYGENVNSESYCEVLLKLLDVIHRKRPGQLARGYCFIMTMPDPMHPEQGRREFKNYSGKFLNIHLTTPTWPLVTSICLVR